MFMRAHTLGLAVVGLLAGVAQAQFPVSVPVHSHPNGSASANANAVDGRDYGLRLDNGRVETFAFDDVRMTFFSPDPVNPNSVFATLTGTIAHLQSSNGVTIGYTGSSGIDALDQRWSISATFRLIGREGTFGGGQAVPYAAMLADLIAGGIGGGQIEFNDVDMSISPLFDEGSTPAVYAGPRAWVEKFNDDGDAFFIRYRHRLNPNVFVGPSWNVNAAAGWLTPANGAMSGDTRDFLFYLVPEPASLGLMALGLPLLFNRRRRIAVAC